MPARSSFCLLKGMEMDEVPNPRPFADDAAIRRIGAGLLACTLGRPEWTHE
jgi:hypothetical protein